MHAVFVMLMCGAPVVAPKGETVVLFDRDVVPVFSHAGCNAGHCHGSPLKRENGGFRLSLFGRRPVADYIAIADASRGPLIDVASAEKSLLLRMATGELQHAGGKPLPRDSAAIRILRDWIRQGAKPPRKDKRFAVRLRIEPEYLESRTTRTVSLRVWAVDSDGGKRNVTQWCRYRIDHRDQGKLKNLADGRFRIDAPGRYTITAHYRGRATTATVDAPYGKRITGNATADRDAIDRLLAARWKTMGLQPAAAADVFRLLQRLSLHLIGRRPNLDEATSFRKSRHPRKVSRLIDELLSHPDYARHWAAYWRSWMRIPRKRLSEGENRSLMDWLSRTLNEGSSALEMARVLSTASGSPGENGAAAFRLAFPAPTERTEATTTLLLGINIRCFRCHDHPRCDRRMDDYHALVACFVGETVRTASATRRLSFSPARYRHPETSAVVIPAVFGQKFTGQFTNPRAAFADWLARDPQRLLARNIVVRYWAALFGESLVAQTDEMQTAVSPPHPKLLDLLTADFVEHGYDVKYLLRRLCASRVYRFDWQTANKKTLSWRGEFSRRLPQRMPDHVLANVLARAAGVSLKEAQAAAPELNRGFLWAGPARPPVAFQPNRCDLQPNDGYLGSALHLINGNTTGRLIRHPRGPARGVE